MNPEPSAAELHWRRIRRLVDEFDFGVQILKFVAELYGREAILNAWNEFRGRGSNADEGTQFEFGSGSPFAKLFISWLAHSWKPERHAEDKVDAGLFQFVPTEEFLERNPTLDPLLYRYLESCTYAPFSFYEVLSCESGKTLNCRDLIVGREYKAFHEASAESLKPGEIVYARLVEIDGIALLEVVAPVIFPPTLKPIVERLRDRVLPEPQMPAEDGLARLLLEDLASELRRLFWDLVDLVIQRTPFDQSPGSEARSRLH